jgi:hypothetical protein
MATLGIQIPQVVLEFVIASNPPVLSVSCNNPPPGIVGTVYTHTFLVSAGTPPYTFSISAGSLPPGLSLNAATGVASGTPTTAGTFPFTVQVTDSASPAGTATVNCSIVIGVNTGSIKITLRGVKPRCKPSDEPQLGAVPQAPSVKRAL